MSDSHLVADAKGRVTAYVGPDATALAAAIVLKGALRLYAEHKIIPTRGMTISKMLARASQYTGKTYRRGGAREAMTDMILWIETMRSALPVEQN